MEHIDWERDRITVISPKTEHHPGGGQRIIPLFADLVRPLTEAFDQAPDGAVYVISRHRSQAESEAGWRNTNLGTPLKKIIVRAGLVPWPKPFHALRASCETELIERGKPIQTGAAGAGHSPKIAVENYLRVLPEHYDEAVRGDAPQNACMIRLARGRT